jgi:AsmA protein
MTGAGSVDLAAKSLAFRVEPRLVLTLQGQGGRIGAPEPVGFGVPVMVQGPWSAPRFYPDVAGILDNPDAAYARLREVGKGLFGSGGGDATGDSLGNALGALIQQGIDAAGAQRGPAVTPDAPGRPPADDSQTMKSIMKQLFGR